MSAGVYRNACPPRPPRPPARTRALFGPRLSAAHEHALAEQLGHARVQHHGRGLLAELTHAGVPLALTLHCDAPDLFAALMGSCVFDWGLTAGAPRGPELLFRMKTAREQFLPPPSSVLLGHPLDASFVALGASDLVTALLDPFVCNALLSIAWTKPCLFVDRGLVQLAWTTDASDRRPPHVETAALYVVTAIANRL